jgi:RNA polymerase sigma-70 factor (ECF subfamily)
VRQAQKGTPGATSINWTKMESRERDLKAGRRTETRIEASPTLVERARHDRAAFGEIYDLYLPRVYAFCRIHSATREEAEDLTAQTFQQALAAVRRYEERGLPFSAWLLRIAANVVADRARRARHVTVAPDELDLVPGESRLENFERAVWLRTHLEALPADQREVVRLRFYEDRSFRDVAERMGRSEGAVKQLLRRALKALHVRMQQEETAADG